MCKFVQYADSAQFLVWVLTTPGCFQNPWGVARSPSFFMSWKCQFSIQNLEKKWSFYHSILEKLFLTSSRSLNRLSRPLQDTKTQKLSLNFRGLQPHCGMLVTYKFYSNQCMINYNSRPNLIYNLTNWWYTYSVCKNWIFNSTLYSATMITFCRGVIRISNPWVPVSYFEPKSRPQIAFLLWYHVFFLKSLGAKRHVLEIYRCQAPMAPMLTVPLLQFSSWTLEFQLKYMLLFCMLFNFFSRISYLSFS